MWGTYHPRRKSSASSLPPLAPYSSAIHESPTSTTRTFSDTPELSHRPSLPRVDEDSQQSADGLVARDYAPPPETGVSADSDHGTQHTLSDSFIYTDHAPSEAVPQRPPALHRKTSPEKVHRLDQLPPPSVHDPYVGQFLTPMTSSDNSRPEMLRSSSAPGVPHVQGLQPSPLTLDTSSSEGKPIFECFNAQISQSAEGQVKRLKGHLEGVLRVQEEIGRLHLGLEKIGQNEHLGESITGTPKPPVTPGLEQATPPSGSRLSQAGSTPGGAKKEEEDAVSSREKGVDEIMERLGQLSARLRKYNDLGTPQLSFPQSGNTPVAPSRGHASKPSLDPSSANRRRANSQKGVPPYSPLRPSPLRQGGGESSTTGSSLLSGKRSQSHLGLASQAVPTEQDISERGVEHDDLHFRNFKMSQDTGGRGHVAKQPSRGDEAWFEHTRPRSRAEGSPRSLREDSEGDRSRPW